jgi:hypothetical protein
MEEYVRQWARAQQLSPTLFEGEQIRANRLAAGSGLEKPGLETSVAALVTGSDATHGLGEKNMSWHGVCGKAHTIAL